MEFNDLSSKSGEIGSPEWSAVCGTLGGLASYPTNPR